MSDTPRTERITENIEIAIRADKREQSIAHKEEAIREIEQLERELAEAREKIDKLKAHILEQSQAIATRRANNLRLDKITREQQELIENIKRLSGAKESDCMAMRDMATKIVGLQEHIEQLRFIAVSGAQEKVSLREQRDRLAEALTYVVQDLEIELSSRGQRDEQWSSLMTAREALAAVKGGPFGCKCDTLAHKVTGDGCSVCNPELHAELLAEEETLSCVSCGEAESDCACKQEEGRPKDIGAEISDALVQSMEAAMKGGKP